MDLYTRTGDDGSTGLFGGQRVDKDAPRVDAYGTIDECNASLGVAAAALDPNHALHQRLGAMITTIQSRLFDLGADLATPLGSPHEDKVARVSDAAGQTLETWIDEIDAANTPMTTFILPGGTELAARLHLARTICRRAERAVVHLRHSESINEAVLVYLNRLSDLLFAMARRVNHEAGVPDVSWVKGDGSDG